MTKYTFKDHGLKEDHIFYKNLIRQTNKFLTDTYVSKVAFDVVIRKHNLFRKWYPLQSKSISNHTIFADGLSSLLELGDKTVAKPGNQFFRSNNLRYKELCQAMYRYCVNIYITPKLKQQDDVN